MINRVCTIAGNWLFWLVYAWVARVLFLIWYLSYTTKLGAIGIYNVFKYGLVLDIAMASYILFIPVAVAIVFTLFHFKKYTSFLNVYNYIVIIIMSLIITADLELYKHWGCRLDNSALQYISTPFEMVASLNWYELTFQIVVLAALIIVGIKSYNLIFIKRNDKTGVFSLAELPIYLFMSAILFVGIRGGISIVPLNTGSAYFSNYQFANHAALNVPYNLGYELNNAQSITNGYNYFSNKQAHKIFNSLNNKNINQPKLLITNRPNIILILSESLTAKIIAPLGGLPNVTPCLNKLCTQGVLFTNNYATGDRSDKGIAAVISGYPGLPHGSILAYPQKSATLPFLSSDLNKAGYTTHWYYGGEINFANMQSYIINAGFNNITSGANFNKSLKQSKWGVHDHVMFNHLLIDINNATEPFFKMFFTLSCHEPFEIPAKSKFKGVDEEARFLSAAYYSDSCLGNFITKAKNSKWWNNTLIIITADHGSRHPGNSPNFVPEKFHTPLLLLGGAVKTDTVINSITSQTDLPLILLNQLNIKPQKPYIYSRNTLLSASNNYAFYIFNSGFGLVTDSCNLCFDNNSKQSLLPQLTCNEQFFNFGKAYMQVYYNDFINR